MTYHNLTLLNNFFILLSIVSNMSKYKKESRVFYYNST